MLHIAMADPPLLCHAITWSEFCHRSALEHSNGSWSCMNRLQTAVGCSLILLALIHKWFSHPWLPGACEWHFASALFSVNNHLYLLTRIHPLYTFLTASIVNLRKTVKSGRVCAGQWKSRSHCSHAAVLQSPTMHLCTAHREHAQYTHFKITFILCPLSSSSFLWPAILPSLYTLY